MNYGTCSECTVNDMTNYGTIIKGSANRSIDNNKIARIVALSTISITNTGTLDVFTDCTSEHEKNFKLINNKGTISFSCKDLEDVPVISTAELTLTEESIFNGTLKIADGIKAIVHGKIDKLLVTDGMVTNSEFTVDKIEASTSIDISKITVTSLATINCTLTDVTFYVNDAELRITSAAVINERVSVFGSNHSTISFESQTPPLLLSLEDSTGLISLPEASSTIIFESVSMKKSTLTVDSESLLFREINGEESQINVQYFSGGMIGMEGASLSECTVIGNSGSVLTIPTGKTLQLHSTSINITTALDGGVIGQGFLSSLEITQSGSFTDALISVSNMTVREMTVQEEPSQEIIDIDIYVSVTNSTVSIEEAGTIGSTDEKVTFEGNEGNIILQADTNTIIKGHVLFSKQLQVTSKGTVTIGGQATVEFQSLSSLIGESGRILLNSASSVLALRGPGNEISPSLSIEGNGSLSLYSELKFQADTENEDCTIGASVVLDKNAELELTNCAKLSFDKNVHWDSGVIGSLRTPHTIVTVKKALSLSTSAKHVLSNVQAVLEGSTTLSSATLRVEGAELLQRGTFMTKDTSEIIGSDQSSFENNAKIDISGLCTISAFEREIVNTGTISVTGKATLSSRGINRGKLSVSATGSAILQGWSFSDTSRLTSSQTIEFSQTYTENSIGTIIIKGTTVLKGTTQNAIIVLPKDSTTTAAEGLQMKNSTISLCGGTMTGTLSVKDNTYFILGCGLLTAAKVDIDATGTLYSGICEEPAVNTMEISNTMITSSGTIELENTQILSQESQLINTETGTLTITAKQPTLEQFPVSVENRGRIQIRSGAKIRLTGSSDGVIVLDDSTAALYFSTSFAFGEHSSVQGGPAYCDNALRLCGTFHEFNCFTGCEMTQSSADATSSAIINTLTIKSTQTVSVKQPLTADALFAEDGCNVVLSNKIVVNKNLNIKKGCLLSGGTITVGVNGKYTIEADAAVSTTLVLSGNGSIDEGAKSISSIYSSGTLSVIPNTSAPTKVELTYVLLCSTGTLASETDHLSVTLLDAEAGSTIQMPGILSTSLSMTDHSTLCAAPNDPQRRTVIDVGMLISKTTVGLPEQSGLLPHTNGILLLEKLYREMNCDDLCVATVAPSYQGATSLHNNGIFLIDEYQNDELTIYNEGVSANAHHWLGMSDAIIYNAYTPYFKDSKDKISYLKEQEQSALQAKQETTLIPVDPNVPPSDHFTKKLPFIFLEDSTVGSLVIKEGTCWASSASSRKTLIQSQTKAARVHRNYQEIQDYLEEDSTLIIIKKDFISREYQQKNGVTLLDGGKLISSAVTICGGSLQGSGTIDGSLSVRADGIVSPRFGAQMLHVSNDLTFSEQGKFISHIKSRTVYDTISSTTLTMQGGMIIVSFPNSTIDDTEKEPFPAVGDEFKLLSFVRKETNAKFATHKLIGTPQGLIEQWDYTADSVILRFIGCAAGMVPDSAMACTFCPLNFWSATGDKECTKCKDGYERKDGQNGCQPISEPVSDETSSSEESEKESTTLPFTIFLLLGFGLLMLVHSSFKRKKYYNVYLEHCTGKKRSRSCSVASTRSTLQRICKVRRKSIQFDKVPALIALLSDLREDPLKYRPIRAEEKRVITPASSPSKPEEECSSEDCAKPISQPLGSKPETTEEPNDKAEFQGESKDSVSEIDVERQKTQESFAESSTSIGMYTFDDTSSLESGSLEDTHSTLKGTCTGNSETWRCDENNKNQSLSPPLLKHLADIDFETQKTTVFDSASSPLRIGSNTLLEIDASPIEGKHSHRQPSTEKVVPSKTEEKEETSKEHLLLLENDFINVNKEGKEKEEKDDDIKKETEENGNDVTKEKEKEEKEKEIQLLTQYLNESLEKTKTGDLPLSIFADIIQEIKTSVIPSALLSKQQSCATVEFLKALENTVQVLKEKQDSTEQLYLQQAKKLEELNYRTMLAKKAGVESPGWATARVNKIEMRNAQPRFIDIDLGASPNLYFKNDQRVNRKLDFSEESG